MGYQGTNNDKRRLNEIGDRLKQMYENPDLKNMKELKSLNQELKQIQNRNRVKNEPTGLEKFFLNLK